MSNKVLIVLQENSGEVALPTSVPSGLREVIYSIIDGLAETAENLVRTLQGSVHYKSVILLTDADCTRKKLLDELVKQTKKDRVIDLIILGHGGNGYLNLHNESLTGGESGNIRSLLVDAEKEDCPSINLRMVSMCNCVAGSVNADWLYIGAKASIGAEGNNYMPEPMMSFFIHNWLSGMKVKDAAKKAYEASIPFFSAVYLPVIIPRFQTMEVPYPCPIWNDPLRICHTNVQVPDAPKIVTNNKIISSKLVVKGDASLKF